MIDYGIVVLLILQLLMVAACAVAFFRIQGQKESYDFKFTTQADLIKGFETKINSALQAVDIATNIPKSLVQKQEAQGSDINELERQVDKLETKLSSTIGRMAASKRWSKKDDDVAEPDGENHLGSEQETNIRPFGRRRQG